MYFTPSIFYLFIILPVEGCSANSRKLVFLKVLARDRFLNFTICFILAAAPLSFHKSILCGKLLKAVSTFIGLLLCLFPPADNPAKASYTLIFSSEDQVKFLGFLREALFCIPKLRVNKNRLSENAFTMIFKNEHYMESNNMCCTVRGLRLKKTTRPSITVHTSKLNLFELNPQYPYI